MWHLICSVNLHIIGLMMAITLAETQIIVRPNSSLSPLGSLKLLVVLAIMALLVALSFLHIGAWLVLPFAGLELVAFAFAFHCLSLHASDFESITVINDMVVIEKRNHKISTKAEFQRYWARVNLRKQTNGRNALFVGSHGKEVEFGAGYINEEQRVSLAKEIKLILKNNL